MTIVLRHLFTNLGIYIQKTIQFELKVVDESSNEIHYAIALFDEAVFELFTNLESSSRTIPYIGTS